MKNDGNPIDPTQRLRNAPRCTATAKRTGERCKAPAVRGWRVCRVHGAGGGAPRGSLHPNFKNGLRTIDQAKLRYLVNKLSNEFDIR